MVHAWRNGAELVTAMRHDRVTEGLVKVATAFCFYRMFNRLVDLFSCRRAPAISAC